MGSALQDRKTPEGDENNRKNRLETYSTDIDKSLDLEKFSKRNDSDFSLSLARS